MDAKFQFTILRDAIEEIGSSVVQVITDSAPVCKSAGLMIEGAYRHIFWTPCCVHSLNNALKDIEKIEWVKQAVLEAREVQMFICNHHTSLALFRSFSKEFLKPAETRYICSVIAPIVDVSRYVDTDAPSLGEIYETIDNMLGKMKRIFVAKDPTFGFYEEHIMPIVMWMWNMMNTPLHMAAFALNPKWYAHLGGGDLPCDDPEVLDGFKRAIDKMYLDQDSSTLRAQFLDFTNLRGPNLGKPQARLDRVVLV